MSTITPELIKAARKFKHDEDEGFYDTPIWHKLPWPEGGLDRLHKHALELSEAANVSVQVASDTIVNFFLNKYLDHLRSQMNN